LKEVKVFAPASVGNFGPGFDVIGLAVDCAGDTVEACKIEKGVVISEITGADFPIPKDAEKNTVGIAARHVLELLDFPGGIELKIHKGIPAGSGLGSSASSAAAGAMAANLLYGEKLSPVELILPATRAEEVVSGGFFADNTAPTLLGGATLTRSYEPLDIISLGTIDELIVVICLPKIQILTAYARSILPKEVSMKGFVSNMANACLIVGAFTQNNYDLLSRCIVDEVIEPVRKQLIPGFDRVKEAALAAGADGVSISGAGPAIFAITNHPARAAAMAEAMKSAFVEEGTEARSLIAKVSQGAKAL
jgi:homoserine kinase